MKGLIRAVLVNSLAIYIASLVLSGLDYSNNIKTLLIAGAVLSIANVIVKPIVKIITLPINLITLGLFSWLINAFILYLTDMLVEGFNIKPFIFYGYSSNGFVVPEISFNLFWATVVFAFIISQITSFINLLND